MFFCSSAQFVCPGLGFEQEEMVPLGFKCSLIFLEIDMLPVQF